LTACKLLIVAAYRDGLQPPLKKARMLYTTGEGKPTLHQGSEVLETRGRVSSRDCCSSRARNAGGVPARKANVQGMPSPAESKTQLQEKRERRLQKHAKRPTRCSRRLQPNSRQPRVDGVSDEGGARCRSSEASKVAKRRCKVGWR
jgi:hypothetical protein